MYRENGENQCLKYKKISAWEKIREMEKWWKSFHDFLSKSSEGKFMENENQTSHFYPRLF